MPDQIPPGVHRRPGTRYDRITDESHGVVDIVPPLTVPEGGSWTVMAHDMSSFVMFTPAGVTVYRRCQNAEAYVVAGEVRYDQTETLDHSFTLTPGDGAHLSVAHGGASLSVVQIEAFDDDSIHVTTYPAPGCRVDTIDGWMR